MENLPKGAVVAFIVLLAVTATFSAFTTYVRPNEVAIKESRLLPPRGVQKGTKEGGRIYVLWPGQKLHRFPTDTQVLELTKGRNTGIMVNTRWEPNVEINTSDGSRVRVDITVLYRITDAYKVMTSIGPGRQFEDSTVIPKTISALKQRLGELSAEDFYNVHKRLEAAENAQDQLDKELRTKGIEIVHVLIRQYYYQQDYQKQIEERKIQDQLVFTSESQAKAATEQAIKREIDGKGEAQVAIEKRRGETEVVKIVARADSYSRKTRAEGDLLVKLAEAKGTELLNNAYRGIGSENLVGMEMAQVLEGLDVIIIPTGGKAGFNPLDLNKTLRLFDVK